MKAIDELRGFLNESPSVVFPDEISEYMDAIERELEERYVELPVDGDGVPIHLLDHLKVDGEIGVFVVGNMTCCTDGWLVGTNMGQIGRPEEDAHHYKPPTVEYVLWELLSNIRPEMEDDEAVPIVRGFAERLQLREGE